MEAARYGRDTHFLGIRASVAAQNLRDARRGCWEGPSPISSLLVAFYQKQRLGEKRGHRIGRHPLGMNWSWRHVIVGDHAEDDIRHCGGPIGAKRRQKRRSHGFLHGFWPFSQRDAAQLLPRLFEPVARLLWPFFVSGFVAGGCPGAELGPLTIKTS